MYFMMDSHSLPWVRLVGKEVIEPPYVHKKRVPGEWIIYMIKEGEMYLDEDDIVYHLTKGDFLLLCPNGCHQGRRSAYCEYFYIHFMHPNIRVVDASEQQMREEMYKTRHMALKSDACKWPSTEDYSDSMLLPKYCHLAEGTAYALLLQELHDLITVNCDHMEYYKTLCGCRLMELIAGISRQCLSAELERCGMITARAHQKVMEVQNYLQTCYQEPMTGEMLSERFDMSFDYLNRLFRRNVGRPIFQYLNGIRIAHARELLTTTSMRVSQISDRVGFADESYFSKVFKKYTGVCPTDYARTFFIEKEDVPFL